MAGLGSIDWISGPALAWVGAAALLYALGGRGRARREGDGRRRAAFLVGLAAIAVAVSPPFDRLADRLFWGHMTQHLILVTVAPPLLALARPWNRMWHGLPLPLRRPLARLTVGRRGRSRWRRTLAVAGAPLASWILFNATFLAWHLPVLYDAALESGPLHAVEHLSFFAAALLFWTRVIDSPPWRSPLGSLGRIAYLGSTLVVGWVLAIVLALEPSPLYSAYADAAARPGGISALSDQQIAAGVMWVPGSIAYTVALVAIAYGWIERERERPRIGAGRLAKAP